ncbi:MAG: 2-C-methyl-D-erythritol 4-phosphate cytidylyltransferase [Dehalococcoidia bacterium]|nr:2-C-methyl-D-erythritol 4-phosphate cytidylyltransferase [Dehalococcoidia bacterium]
MAEQDLAERLGGRVGAVLVAAGGSRRMGGVDKVFAPVLGQPLVSCSLDVLEACPMVDEIVLVLSTDNLALGRELVKTGGWRKVRQVCQGGERRRDSVQRGLDALVEVKWVVVHDAARPCVTADMLVRGLEAALETGAAIAAVPVADTIKVVGADGVITATPARSELWAAQTPQVFLRELLVRAHQAGDADATDDSVLVERLGSPVRVFEGSVMNVKVTTPSDLLVAEAFLRAQRATGGR